MRKFINYALLLLLYSCTIPYDLETRYIVEAKLVDYNGNSLANEGFNLHVNAINSEIISRSVSDSNGIIRMIFPKPALQEFTFTLNKNATGNYYYKAISNIKTENFVNYKLVLNEIKLVKFNEIISLNIELNQVNQNKEVRKIEVIGDVYDEYESYNPIENAENSLDLQTYFTLLKNQNFTLKYSVFDYTTMLLEVNNVNLSIDEQPLTYVLNY